MLTMISLIFFLIILLQLSLCSSFNDMMELQKPTKWTINFFDAKNSLNKITVEAGRFFPCQMEVTSTNDQIPIHDKTELKLPTSSQVRIPQEKYKIDTLEGRKYPFFIGVPCGTENGTIEVTFNQTNPEKFIVNLLKVEVNTVSQNMISVNIPLTQLPAGCFSQMQFLFQLGTVDLLNIKWDKVDSNNHETAKVEDIIIPPFQEVNQQYTAKYHVAKYDSSRAIQKFKPLDINQCTRLNITELVFIATEEKPPAMTNDIKNAILNSIKIETPNEKNGIKVSFIVPQAPVLLSCTLTCRKMGFITDDEIRQQDKSIYFPLANKFYKAYISNPGIHIIDWPYVARGGSYKMKCIVDSTTINESERTFVTWIIGRHKDSDMNIPLVTLKNFPPSSAHCQTWQFSSEVDMNILEPTVIAYCDKIFSNNLISREQNGCVTCLSRTSPDIEMCSYKPKDNRGESDSTTLSVCARSHPGCATDHPQMKETFEKLIAGLGTDQAIRTTLELDPTFVLGLRNNFTESDLASPNIKGITAKVLKIDDDSIIYNVKSSVDQEIECNVKIITSDKAKGLVFEDIEDDVIIIPRGEKLNKFFYKFKDGSKADKKLYSIILGCFNLPQVNYHYHTTPITTIAIFNRTVINCTDTPNIPECRTKRPHSIPEQRGNNPKKDNMDKLSQFSKLDTYEKKKIIISVKDEITAAKTIRETFDSSILFNEMLAVTECKDFELFTDCIDFKKDNQRQVIKQLKRILSCDKLEENLKASDGSTEEDNIKLSLFALWGLADNTDSNDKDASTDLMVITSCLAKEASTLIQMLTAALKDKVTETAKDVASLLMALTSNMIDVIKIDEFDGNLDEVKPGKRSSLLLHPKTMALKTAIEFNVITMIKHGETSITVDNLQVHNSIMKDKSPKRTFENEDHEVITFHETIEGGKTSNTTVMIPTEYLQKLNSSITNVGAVLYSSYPLLSVGSQNFSSKVLGLRMYNKEGIEVPINFLEVPILVKFPQRNPSFNYCIFFDEAKGDWTGLGIKTVIQEGEPFVTCELFHLTDVTIGSENYGEYIPSNKSYETLIIIIAVFGSVVLAGILIFLILFCCKKKSSEESLINENTSKDLQMKRVQT